jgi:hypothetical protein
MKIQHPLINKTDSAHYDSTKTPAILDFERLYSISDLRAWSKLNVAKYEHPARKNKGQVEADRRKAKTYRDYYTFLTGIISKYPALSEVTAVTAYEALDYEMQY